MLVEATLDHFESFYVLKCERTNIEWTGFSQAPSKDHFYKWYRVLKFVHSCEG